MITKAWPRNELICGNSWGLIRQKVRAEMRFSEFLQLLELIMLFIEFFKFLDQFPGVSLQMHDPQVIILICS